MSIIRARADGNLAGSAAQNAFIALTLLLPLTLASCGGGPSTQKQPPAASFFLLGSGTLRPLVTVGSSTSYDIGASVSTVTAGMIAVTITGVPSGLTVSPDTFSLDPNSNSPQAVTITATSSLLPGIYPITVTGSNQSASNSITVNVGAVEPTPSPTPLQANVVYSFSGASDGGAASGPMIADSAGNLYGVTNEGGTNGLGGTVFELSLSNGAWQKTVLYSFDDGQPVGALVFDNVGNLYGVTGETGNLCNPNGCSGSSDGTVYELTPTGSGWQRTVLHTFSGPPDGDDPAAGLLIDQAGNLYGTTEYGGDSSIVKCGGAGCGTIFTLQRSGNSWAYSVIHTFEFSDGASPQSELIVNSQGNLYGTAFTGGDDNCPWAQRSVIGIEFGPECGTVFELTFSGGAWQENTIYTFHASYEGAGPMGLVLDDAGNLYGVTTYGGFDTALCGQCGNFFKLIPGASGWTFSQLYDFVGGDDGQQPFTNLVRDQAGNIYGVTQNGGPPNCGDSTSGFYGCGTVVRLSQTGGMGQTGQGVIATGYYVFPGGAAGWIPWSLTLSGGHLYGTTQEGGASPGSGVIFEIP